MTYVGGRTATSSYPQNSTTLTVNYDAAARPTSMSARRSNSTVVTQITDTYDGASNLLTETETNAPGAQATYSYDSANRLLSMTRPGSEDPQDQSYTMDGAGNHTALSHPSVPTSTETRQYSSTNELYNRTTSLTSTNLTYDSNGQLTNDGTFSYSWDAFGRLRTVTRDSDQALIARYSYDSLGRRQLATVTNDGPLDGTTRFLYDGVEQIENRNASGTTTQQTVFAGGQPDILDNYTNGKDQRLFLYQDPIGSTMAVANTSAQIVEAYLYDAYGQPTTVDPGPSGQVVFGPPDVVTPGGTSPVGNKWLFAAVPYDTETGLYYTQARYRNPILGSFISPDPIGPWADPVNTGNRYTYAGDNPIAYTDPQWA
jgi:RHS repeat-associated protein